MLSLPRECVKCAMIGGSEVSGGWSKHRLLRTDLRIMVNDMVLWRSAAAPPPPPNPHTHHSMTLHATSQSDYELRSPQERVKYVMLGGSKVVVGTSIASYDLMRASWCCDDGPPPRTRPLLTTSALHLSTRPPNVIVSLDCPKGTVVCLSCPIAPISVAFHSI